HSDGVLHILGAENALIGQQGHVDLIPQPGTVSSLPRLLLKSGDRGIMRPGQDFGVMPQGS
ncbi:MAG: hypothetical protein AAF311_14730, partial [Pseudomonadota bacterium]